MKKLLYSILFSVIVYGLFIKYFGINEVIASFASLNYFYIVCSLMSVFLAILVEYIRWEYFLKIIKVEIPKMKSLRIFLSGLALGVLPAKSGELVRCFLLKNNNVSLKKGFSVHLVSQIFSFIAVFIMALPVFFLFDMAYISYILIVFSIIMVLSLNYPRFYLKLLKVLKSKYDLKIFRELEKLFIILKDFFSFKVFMVSTFLSFLAYGFFFINLYFVTLNFDVSVSVFLIFSVYCLSLIVGVVSMFPGGIGVVEGGVVLMLSSYMDSTIAFSIIVLLRIVAFWTTVFVGIFALNYELTDINSTFKEIKL